MLRQCTTMVWSLVVDRRRMRARAGVTSYSVFPRSYIYSCTVGQGLRATEGRLDARLALVRKVFRGRVGHKKKTHKKNWLRKVVRPKPDRPDRVLRLCMSQVTYGLAMYVHSMPVPYYTVQWLQEDHQWTLLQWGSKVSTNWSNTWKHACYCAFMYTFTETHV